MNRRKREQNERIKRRQQRQIDELLRFQQAIPVIVKFMADVSQQMTAKLQEWAVLLAKFQPPGHMVIERAMTGDLLSAAEARRLGYFHETWEGWIAKRS
jgi:hypothetical protein